MQARSPIHSFCSDEIGGEAHRGQIVLAKLSELMFIKVVRRHLEALPPEQPGGWQACRDPFVGEALSLMRETAPYNWTVEELAKRDWPVSLGSGGTFFATYWVLPPMHRQIADADASERLSGGNANVATVAAELATNRGGFQPCFQEDDGRAAVGLASPCPTLEHFPLMLIHNLRVARN